MKLNTCEYFRLVALMLWLVSCSGSGISDSPDSILVEGTDLSAYEEIYSDHEAVSSPLQSENMRDVEVVYPKMNREEFHILNSISHNIDTIFVIKSANNAFKYLHFDGKDMLLEFVLRDRTWRLRNKVQVGMQKREVLHLLDIFEFHPSRKIALTDESGFSILLLDFDKNDRLTTIQYVSLVSY